MFFIDNLPWFFVLLVIGYLLLVYLNVGHRAAYVIAGCTVGFIICVNILCILIAAVAIDLSMKEEPSQTGQYCVKPCDPIKPLKEHTME